MTENSLKAKIIVLIPVYNDWEALYKSVFSIREQIAIDLMIVDDGSERRGDIAKLREMYTLGSVHFIQLPQNLGIEHALNAGLNKIKKLAQHYLVARLDCGDLCMANRFKIQFEYFQKEKDLMLLGSQVNFVDSNGILIFKSKLPHSYKDLKKMFFFNCQVIHPTVMFRLDVVDHVGLYPLGYKAAEDYAFFFAILKCNRVENLDIALVDVVVNENGISTLNRKRQVVSRLKIIRENYYFGFYPTIGLLRNLILYFVPRKGVVFLRKLMQ